VTSINSCNLLELHLLLSQLLGYIHYSGCFKPILKLQLLEPIVDGYLGVFSEPGSEFLFSSDFIDALFFRQYDGDVHQFLFLC
jgi:hypothetical protein